MEAVNPLEDKIVHTESLNLVCNATPHYWTLNYAHYDDYLHYLTHLKLLLFQ